MQRKRVTPIGVLVHTNRKLCDMRLKELSRAIGVSFQFISNIEQGRAPLPWKFVPRVAKALGLSVHDVAQAALFSTHEWRQYSKLADKDKTHAA